MPDSRTWWIGFAAFAAVLLGGLALAGLVDRDLPGALVEDRGLVSVLTDGAWMAACVTSVAVAVRARRGGRRWKAWVGLAGLAALAAWEEAEWSIGPLAPRDLHNAVTVPLADRFGAAFVVALAVLGAVAAVGLVGWMRRRPVVVGVEIAPHLAVAAGLLGVALLPDVAVESGLPYWTGMWPLEEATELLAAVAVLGAPLRALAVRRDAGLRGAARARAGR